MANAIGQVEGLLTANELALGGAAPRADRACDSRFPAAHTTVNISNMGSSGMSKQMPRVDGRYFIISNMRRVVVG
jgi:hypothetical protein